jgi:alpha-beta hydrolase superfamily lysophospholipase
MGGVVFSKALPGALVPSCFRNGGKNMRSSYIVAWAAIALVAGSVCAGADYPESVPVPKGSPRPTYKELKVWARDGTKLVVHEWAPPVYPAGNPVVLFIHGIGMHGKPYASIAAGFTSRKLVLVMPDLRGHGQSNGKRGELAEPHVLRADLGAVIGLIHQRHPKAPVVLAGESMGGLIAADYAWRGERRLAGLALLAPAFAVHPSQINLSDVGWALLDGVALTTDGKLKASTRDEGFINARKKDGLALRKVNSSYLIAIAGLQRDWPRAAAGLKQPLFIGCAGKDKVIDSTIVKAFYDRAGAAKKTWKPWNEAYHTLCWDPLTPRVIDEVATWALTLSKKEKRKPRSKGSRPW